MTFYDRCITSYEELPMTKLRYRSTTWLNEDGSKFCVRRERDPSCNQGQRVWIETKNSAEQFLAQDHSEPCCYGHAHCSSFLWGPCLDETLSNFPELA